MHCCHRNAHPETALVPTVHTYIYNRERTIQHGVPAQYEPTEGLHLAHVENEPRPGLEQLDPLRSWGAVCLNRLGRLEVVPQLLKEAWAVTPCHMPHQRARLGTFLPLQK